MTGLAADSAQTDLVALAARWGLKSGARIGNYELTKLLGEGGMGAVWAARHATLKKRVAIKTMKPEFATDATYVNRFLLEGQAAARIQHPNAVDVTDVGVVDGVPYLVMEFLEGESLAAKLLRDGPMKPKDVANLVVPVLCALVAAHKMGVVHRDVKPENIFLTLGRDGVLAPILLDFGISQLVTDKPRLTQTFTFLGTPHYMSPEQCNDAKNVDVRTDVYATGVLLYECLAGRKPFDGPNVMALVRAISTADCKRLDVARPNLPGELIEIVHQAMHVDRDYRTGSAAELATHLITYAGTKVRATYGPELGLGEASQIVAQAADTGRHQAVRNANIGYADTLQGPATPTPIGLVAPSAETLQKAAFRRRLAFGLGAAALITVGAAAWFALQWTDGVAAGANVTPAAAIQIVAPAGPSRVEAVQAPVAATPVPTAEAPAPPSPDVAATPAAEEPVAAERHHRSSKRRGTRIYNVQ